MCLECKAKFQLFDLSCMDKERTFLIYCALPVPFLKKDWCKPDPVKYNHFFDFTLCLVFLYEETGTSAYVSLSETGLTRSQTIQLAAGKKLPCF